uniref:Uncharacterized protein n=1 Tax=Zooxanthella nutricula TaxID=1333877 RepID=A0A6V0G024_9DINO|mmetsp:Transcript_6445/g.19050  ORF Transcript_6445/g.19050 Transcript_6445/m.19050 type:complete len:397 (+) Transcript_6445:82-1272(+)
MAVAIVVDGVLNESSRHSLLQKLPSLEKGASRALPTVMAPLALERCMRAIAEAAGRAGSPAGEFALPLSFVDGEPEVPMPARLACGSVPLHKDCFNPFDTAEPLPIDGYVAILYLSGTGQLVIQGGGSEQVVDVVPGRLVAWPNKRCYHRFDAPSDSVRTMVGPLAIDADGLTQRAHDVWSTHPGYIGSCRNAAADAERQGDHEAVLRNIRNIGIPVVAAQLEREYEERRRQNVAPRRIATLTREPGGAAVGDKEAARLFMDGAEARTAALVAEIKALDGEDQKAARSEKGKEIRAVTASPEYRDADRVLRGLEPVGDNFMKQVDFWIVCTGLDGERIGQVPADNGATFGSKQDELIEAVKTPGCDPFLGPIFLLQDGTMLGDQHASAAVEELLPQ